MKTNLEIKGGLVNLLTNNKSDPGNLRPWINEKDGRSYVTNHKGGAINVPANYITNSINRLRF